MILLPLLPAAAVVDRTHVITVHTCIKYHMLYAQVVRTYHSPYNNQNEEKKNSYVKPKMRYSCENTTREFFFALFLNLNSYRAI